jgi:hypothetical protein
MMEREAAAETAAALPKTARAMEEALAKPRTEPSYSPANTKPRGMPLTTAEVEARFGRHGDELVAQTQAEAVRIGQTQSGNKRGPVLTGVRDPVTGETHYGQNRLAGSSLCFTAFS